MTGDHWAGSVQMAAGKCLVEDPRPPVPLKEGVDVEIFAFSVRPTFYHPNRLC
jgi:hypothetical protein